jgi:LacI family transcriptional regulator
VSRVLQIQGNGMSTKKRALAKAPGRASRPPTRPTSRDGRGVTINDIARIAGVSKKTVSRVLNRSPLVHEDTRARIQAVMDRYRYVPDPQARGLAFRRSFLVGLVYDNPNAQYIVNMMEGALDGLRGSECELVVHPCDRHSSDFVPGVRRFVDRQKLRGVILLPPISENEALVEALREAGTAYVRVSYAMLDAPTRMMVSNDRQAVAQVASYLQSLGHQRIGYITGPRGFMSARERREGFIEALEQRGLSLPEEMIVEGGYTYESGFSGADILLGRTPRPTAIFASNDEMAAGVYRAAHSRGLAVPRDLSVVGFDDGPIAARLMPPLTTVRLPIRDIGRLAARKLVVPGSADAAATDSLVVPHLVIRDSCQPPGA